MCSIDDVIHAAKIQSEAMESTAKMPQKVTKTVLGQRPLGLEPSFVDSSPRKGLSWAALKKIGNPLDSFDVYKITNIYR